MILKTQVFASSLCPAGVSYPFTFMLDSVLVIISESRHGTLDFHIAQLVKNPRAMQETPVQFLGWEIHWGRNRLLTPLYLGFPCGSAGKESTHNAGDLGSIPRVGRSPGEGKSYPLLACRIPWTV